MAYTFDSSALERAAKAAKDLEKFPNAKEILFGTISPALVVHTGPGLLAMGIQVIR